MALPFYPIPAADPTPIGGFEWTNDGRANDGWDGPFLHKLIIEAIRRFLDLLLRRNFKMEKTINLNVSVGE